MSKSKQKGSSFEREVADYMAERLGDERIDRMPLHGTKDRGDIAGFRFRGLPCVVECKNAKRMELSAWLDEAEVERGNADAEYGVVVHHRKGCGKARFGENYVTMTLDTLLAMSVGGNDLLEDRE